MRTSDRRVDQCGPWTFNSYVPFQRELEGPLERAALAKLDRKIEEHRLKELNSSRTTPRTSVVLSQRTTSLNSKLQSHQLRYPGARKYSRESSRYADGLPSSTVRGLMGLTIDGHWLRKTQSVNLLFRSQANQPRTSVPNLSTRKTSVPMY